MGFVADEAIPVFAVPDWGGRDFTVAAQTTADLGGGESLPGCDDFGRGPRIDGLEENVNVIGHDDPFE